jgi:hypothetical protein
LECVPVIQIVFSRSVAGPAAQEADHHIVSPYGEGGSTQAHSVTRSGLTRYGRFRWDYESVLKVDDSAGLEKNGLGTGLRQRRAQGPWAIVAQ